MPDTISRLEKRYYKAIKVENPGKLAEALDVTVEELFEKVEVDTELSSEKQVG